MKTIKRILLTISATWIYVLLYYLNLTLAYFTSNSPKKLNLIFNFHPITEIILLFIGTMIMFLIPYYHSKKKGTDNIEKAHLIQLEDNSFVPSYLGYFFISISIDNYISMIGFYLIILIFMYYAGVEYFNPIFLLFGYHIYKVESSLGVQSILILKNKTGVIRKSDTLNNLTHLNRINNLTYIGRIEQ